MVPPTQVGVYNRIFAVEQSVDRLSSRVSGIEASNASISETLKPIKTALETLTGLHKMVGVVTGIASLLTAIGTAIHILRH